MYSSYFIILSHYTPPPIISLSNGTNPLVEDYEDISWAKTYLTKHKTTVEFAPAENVKTFYDPFGRGYDSKVSEVYIMHNKE